jgi:hypothetical protein
MRHLPERWGPFAGVGGLPLIIVGSNALVYVFELFRPGLMSLLTLSPLAVPRGEWWRFVTFLFVPPPLNPLFAFFWLYLLYLYAQALETAWGSFRFTLYYLIGALATMSAAFIPAWGSVPNVYLNASLFLAYAVLHPDVEFLIFFVVPLKVKYIGYFTGAWLAWTLWGGSFFERMVLMAGLLNFFLFFGPVTWDAARLRWRVWQNRRRF